MEVCSRTSITTVSHAFLSTATPRSRRASCSGVNPFSFLPANLSIIPIQPVLCDVALDGRRQLSADRPPGCDRAPQGARRHVRGRNVALDDARRIEPESSELRNLYLSEAGPVDDHHRGKLAHPIGFMPRAKQARGVPTKD